MRLPPLVLTLAAIVTTVACSAPIPIAFARAADGRNDVPATPVISALDPTDDKRIAIAPARFEVMQIPAGATRQVVLDARNHTDEPVTISTLVLPLEGSSDPDSFATPASANSRSAMAVDWIDVPFRRWRDLPPNSQLRFPVTIDVPADAAPGTYALGLAISRRVSNAGLGGLDASEARIQLDADAASQLVIQVPGDATADLRVRDVNSPRIAWAGRTTRFEAMAYNEGDTLLDVDAEVQLDAFIGTASRNLSSETQLLLPGGQRAIELAWTDPPLFGYFQPDLVVVGGEGSGIRVERSLPPVWVLPPWWFLVLAILAIVVPVWRIQRRRRSETWQEQRRERAIERVEARERNSQARARAEQARRRGDRR